MLLQHMRSHSCPVQLSSYRVAAGSGDEFIDVDNKAPASSVIDADSKSEDSTCQLLASASQGDEQLGTMNQGEESTDSMGLRSQGSLPVSPYEIRGFVYHNSFYGDLGRRELRVTNPDPASPPTTSVSLTDFGPLGSPCDAPQSSESVFEDSYSPSRSRFHAPGHNNLYPPFGFGSGPSYTPPLHTRPAPLRDVHQQEQQETRERFYPNSPVSTSRTYERSADFAFAPPRRILDFGEPAHTGTLRFTGVAGEPWFELPDEDPFVTRPGQESQGSIFFLQRLYACLRATEEQDNPLRTRSNQNTQIPRLPLPFPRADSRSDRDEEFENLASENSAPNSPQSNSPSLVNSRRVFCEGLGYLPVRFQNFTEARIFVRAYNSRAAPEHAIGIDDVFVRLPNIDYESTRDFYPVYEPRQPPPAMSDNSAAMDTDTDAESSIFDSEEDQLMEDKPNSAEPHNGLGQFDIPNFANGQPNAAPDARTFFQTYPVQHLEPADAEWSLLYDSTYGPPIQKPSLFFVSPPLPTYPNHTSAGFLVMRYWRQDEQGHQQRKVALLPFVRDWYASTDEFSFGDASERELKIIIEPYKMCILGKDFCAEIPNFPFSWTLLGQLFLVAIFPELPLPKAKELFERWAKGQLKYQHTLPSTHPGLLVHRDPDMLESSQDPCLYHAFYIDPGFIMISFIPTLAKKILSDCLAPAEGGYYADPRTGDLVAAFERNLSFVQFVKQWFVRYRLSSRQTLRPLPQPFANVQYPAIFEAAVDVADWKRPTRVDREDVEGETYDIQGINWHSLGVLRRDARRLRDSLYNPYTNLTNYAPYSIHGAVELPDDRRYFHFEKLQSCVKPQITHFQLRNLMDIIDKNVVTWVEDRRVHITDINYDTTTEVINLSKFGDEFFGHGSRLSSMKTAYGVVAAGGYEGEYVINRIDCTPLNQAKGQLTTGANAITNHVDLYQHRHSSVPQAFFSSNDRTTRLVDTERNQIVFDHSFSFSINCSATSPDRRLRVVVGDDPVAHIINAETGASERELEDHTDHGFACAWSPDGVQVATGNQDGTVLVWDSRMWRRIATIPADVAGYRSMAFSPAGGGPRVLLLAEPADRVSVVDARRYDARQVHDFFGEIGGISFTPDGASFAVANCDSKVGGLMWYNRSHWGGLGTADPRGTMSLVREYRGDEYSDDEEGPYRDEWLPEEDSGVRPLRTEEEELHDTFEYRTRRGLIAEMGDMML